MDCHVVLRTPRNDRKVDFIQLIDKWHFATQTSFARNDEKQTYFAFLSQVVTCAFYALLTL
jgi:hypothetical protein